jgi:SIR2-like protein
MAEFVYRADDPELYRPLRNSLETEDLVLFAGSGLSAQAETDDGRRPPLWKGLLTGMAGWARETNLLEEEEERAITELLEAGFLIDAGQELADCLQTQLQRCVAAIILANEAKTGHAHQLAAKINFRAYLTTNYDGFLEEAYSRLHGVALKKFYERTLFNVMDAWRRKERFILKLHGDISDPETLILGTRSYERLLDRDEGYISCLENIISNASVLFVGFGGSDPDLDSITSRVAQFDGRLRRHWMVVPQGELPPLRAKRLANDRGIQVIEYDHDPKRDPTHKGLVAFLERLAQPQPVPATAGRPSRPRGAFAASTVGARS